MDESARIPNCEHVVPVVEPVKEMSFAAKALLVLAILAVFAFVGWIVWLINQLFNGQALVG